MDENLLCETCSKGLCENEGTVKSSKTVKQGTSKMDTILNILIFLYVLICLIEVLTLKRGFKH